MYTPPAFRWDDRPAALALAREWNFGLLITQGEGAPFVTHLPMLIDERRNVVRGHLARANPHGGHLDKRDHLAVFSGPHAYISPDWYGEASTDVPTWNYLAVHVSGKGRVLSEEGVVDRLLAELSALEEGRRPDLPNGGRVWTMDEIPADKHARMRNAIVAFEIDIERVEAKAKLSQNKLAEAVAGVIEALGSSGTESSAGLARLMQAFDTRRRS